LLKGRASNVRTLVPLVLSFAAVLSNGCLGAELGEEEDEETTFLMEQAYEDNVAADQLDGDIAAGTVCNGVIVPDHTNFKKHIALTFDDGPNPATTPKVIQILHKHHAPATFFNNGSRYSAAAKTIAHQIATDPDFILANHSQNHLNLPTLSIAKVKTEIDRTTTLIKAAGEQPKYFRFPFGSANCTTMKLVRDRHYIVVGWSIDSADWCYAAGGGVCKKSTFKYVPDSMRSNMLAYIKSQAHATGGGVILMHDIHANTANHLDAILTMLENDGYTFVRLDNKTVFPKLNAGT
jgi:peptidoglycan/xylan/chitin deacetylase (PgdA/CDA1 family)